MQIAELVTTIAARLQMDQATAENTVGTILSVLHHEADGTQVDTLFDRIDGARDLAQRHDVMAPSPTGSGGGLLDMIGSALGERAGALIHGVERLKASGLSVAQIQQAGAELVAQMKAAAGPQVVDKIVASVPGLKGHFGL